MVEYGVKKLITNPTLITNSDDIVKVIDARNNQTKAFIVPLKYKALMQKLIKELEFQKWAKEKKELIGSTKKNSDDKYLSELGWDDIEEYLHD
jgi:hypothetical protein